MMYHTATYWPPKSWEESDRLPCLIQAIWTVEGDGEIKVYLQEDVAEGGYLFDGVIQVHNPLILNRAREIIRFYSFPDLRSLKQIRIAVVAGRILEGQGQGQDA